MKYPALIENCKRYHRIGHFRIAVIVTKFVLRPSENWAASNYTAARDSEKRICLSPGTVGSLSLQSQPSTADCPLSSHKGHWWHQVGKGHSGHHVSFIASVDRQTRIVINGDWLRVIPTDVVRFVTVAAANFLLFLCLLYQQENKLSSYSFQTKILLPILLHYMFLVYYFISFASSNLSATHNISSKSSTSPLLLFVNIHLCSFMTTWVYERQT